MKASSVRLVGLGALASVASAIDGCTFTSELRTGFDATFYRFPLWHYETDDKTYFDNYKDLGGSFATVSGVSDIAFSGGDPNNNDAQMGTIYGQSVTATNFTVELDGYFKAEESGTYNITLAADDGYAAYFGSGGSCCVDASKSAVTDPDFYGMKSNGDLGTVATSSIVQDLVAGTYYPFKIVYINRGTQWALRGSVISPSGSTSTVFDMVYQIDSSQGQCGETTTTVTEGTNSDYPTPGTYTASDCTQVATCTVEVITPGPTTTTVTEGTNSDFPTPGTYTPSDCSDVETCTVEVITPGATTTTVTEGTNSVPS